MEVNRGGKTPVLDKIHTPQRRLPDIRLARVGFARENPMPPLHRLRDCTGRMRPAVKKVIA
jgi:hypothetical protein